LKEDERRARKNEGGGRKSEGRMREEEGRGKENEGNRKEEEGRMRSSTLHNYCRRPQAPQYSIVERAVKWK
jgi:hypothetical protein